MKRPWIAKKFFTAIRGSVFGGRLTADQVVGIEQLLTACEAYLVTDQRHVAYVLATPMIETGGSFEPIVENLNYSAAGLQTTFGKYFTIADAAAYARQSQRIANRAYANRIGRQRSLR